MSEHERAAEIPTAQATIHRPKVFAQIATLLLGIVLLLATLTTAFWSSASLPLLSQTSSHAPPERIRGEVVFTSSGQLDPSSETGLNDQVAVAVNGVPVPAAGNSDYVWLLPDPDQVEMPSLLLGTLAIQAGKASTLSYTNPDHIDLLARFSQLLITEEPSTSQPLQPSPNAGSFRARGSIPNAPNPTDPNRYSNLDHVRHLLAQDPDLQHIGLGGGLSSWLDRNSEKILEWASAARDEWGKAGATDPLRREIIRILDYLDGVNYVWRDVPAGTPFLADLPAGRIGLLEQDPLQNPPAYLSHVALHLNGLIHAPGVSAEQRHLASQIDQALQHVTALMTALHTAAVQLVQMSATQLGASMALTLLNALVTNATAAFVGQPESVAASQQGVAWISQTLVSFAVIALGPP